MPAVEAIQGSFHFTNNLVPLALGDLSDEDSVKRSRQGEGPSVAWTIGHLLHYRYLTMKLLGVNKESPYEKDFGSVGATDGSGYPSVTELRTQWSAVQEQLDQAFAAASDETLDQPAPGPGGHGEQKVIDSLTFFMWHESYHMGGLSAIRKDLGLPGIAELVMARMAAQQA
jgi:uncharacterized damage-inducible protein DinB